MIKKEYNKKKKIIKKRLKEFSQNKDFFYELCFCLLTPQSNAKKCWEGVKVLKNLDFYNKSVKISKLRSVLKTKTRFYKNKSKYLVELKRKYNFINENIKEKKKELREFLVKNVKGLGYKEASHFLRNIGFRNLGILDRHILNVLLELKVINEIPKNLNKSKYFQIENKFYQFSSKIGIPMDELDLLFWSMKTGVVFK